jgi:hypothetical protein
MQFIDDLMIYLGTCPIDGDGTAYVYIVSFPLFAIQDSTRAYIQKVFEPTEQVCTRLQERLTELRLSPCTYHVIHIRTGDQFLFNQDTVQDHKGILHRILTTLQTVMQPSQQYVIISDSNKLKQYAQTHCPSLQWIDNRPVHFGEKQDPTTLQLLDTMVDYSMMTHALSIYSMSYYAHGSGFSKWCAETYSIPYESVYYCAE